MDAYVLVANLYAKMTLEQKKITAQELFDKLSFLLVLIHQEDPKFELK